MLLCFTVTYQFLLVNETGFTSRYFPLWDKNCFNVEFVIEQLYYGCLRLAICKITFYCCKLHFCKCKKMSFCRHESSHITKFIKMSRTFSYQRALIIPTHQPIYLRINLCACAHVKDNKSSCSAWHMIIFCYDSTYLCTSYINHYDYSIDTEVNWL